MTKTVTISDDLALRLEQRRKENGGESLDDVAEAVIVLGLVYDEAEFDENAGYADEELRTMIAEGDASGPAEPWSAAELTAEVRRRQAARQGRGG
ncbi:MAG TPA: hypothetical protein VGI95_20015 [Caulobacteraceae bacterium]|jgi:hypothetical protein